MNEALTENKAKYKINSLEKIYFIYFIDIIEKNEGKGKIEDWKSHECEKNQYDKCK